MYSDGTLGVVEAAEICGVSAETIRRRLRGAAFPGAQQRPGTGEWRIPASDLVAAGFDLGSHNDSERGEAARRVLEVELARAETLASERLARIEVLERVITMLETIIISNRSSS